MPPGLSPIHMLVVLLVALVVLGPEKLPDAARQAGRAFAELRRWSAHFESEVRGALELGAEPAPTGDVANDAVGANESERSNPGPDPTPLAQAALEQQTEERA